jgi:predicted TIM-barrel fold metal-dependent hydrolase
MGVLSNPFIQPVSRFFKLDTAFKTDIDLAKTMEVTNMKNWPFIIDMQAHYIPPEALKLVRKTKEFDYTVSLRRLGKAYEMITNIETQLEWMDDSGIRMAILSTAAYSANGYRFCKVCNDGYAQVLKRYSDRFRAMIQVYPHDKNRNKDEIKRGVEELGLWGIAVVSSYQRMTIDSPLMDPIYEMAIKYNMPVYVHPPIRNKLWGGERYDLYMMLSREYDIAKSFLEMVYGVLPRYPELTLIFAHFGGGLPALKGRMLAWHQPKDFPLPDAERGHGFSVRQAKELGLVDDFEARVKKVYYDSAGLGGWLPVMKSAFETLGADHICFGTDYPYELREPKYLRKIIHDITQIKVPDKDKEKFFGGNLKKLFHIK